MATTMLPAAKRTSKSGTTIFLKTLMAVSGLIFVGYVLLHMYGNLKMLAGEEAFNTYAHHLRTFGEPMLPYGGLLWIFRVVLILALVAHVYSAAALTARSSKARPHKYAVKKANGTPLTSRTMRWGGLALLLFVIFHLVQFTVPKVNFSGGATDNPFRLVQGSFELWWVFLIYALAMLALAMHLMHGTFSAAQTLGLTSTAGARKAAKGVGHLLGAVVAIGFIVPPFLILIDQIN